jgi:hypothetical protein
MEEISSFMMDLLQRCASELAWATPPGCGTAARHGVDFDPGTQTNVPRCDRLIATRRPFVPGGGG